MERRELGYQIIYNLLSLFLLNFLVFYLIHNNTRALAAAIIGETVASQHISDFYSGSTLSKFLTYYGKGIFFRDWGTHWYSGTDNRLEMLPFIEKSFISFGTTLTLTIGLSVLYFVLRKQTNLSSGFQNLIKSGFPLFVVFSILILWYVLASRNGIRMMYDGTTDRSYSIIAPYEFFHLTSIIVLSSTIIISKYEQYQSELVHTGKDKIYPTHDQPTEVSSILDGPLVLILAIRNSLKSYIGLWILIPSIVNSPNLGRSFVQSIGLYNFETVLYIFFQITLIFYFLRFVLDYAFLSQTTEPIYCYLQKQRHFKLSSMRLFVFICSIIFMLWSLYPAFIGLAYPIDTIQSQLQAKINNFWNPFYVNISEVNRPPGNDHPLGTDQLGRDLWASWFFAWTPIALTFIIALIVRSLLISLIARIQMRYPEGITAIIDQLRNMPILIIIPLLYLTLVTANDVSLISSAIRWGLYGSIFLWPLTYDIEFSTHESLAKKIGMTSIAVYFWVFIEYIVIQLVGLTYDNISFVTRSNELVTTEYLIQLLAFLLPLIVIPSMLFAVRSK